MQSTLLEVISIGMMAAAIGFAMRAMVYALIVALFHHQSCPRLPADEHQRQQFFAAAKRKIVFGCLWFAMFAYLGAAFAWLAGRSMGK